MNETVYIENQRSKKAHQCFVILSLSPAKIIWLTEPMKNLYLGSWATFLKLNHFALSPPPNTHLAHPNGRFLTYKIKFNNPLCGLQGFLWPYISTLRENLFVSSETCASSSPTVIVLFCNCYCTYLYLT